MGFKPAKLTSEHVDFPNIPNQRRFSNLFSLVFLSPTNSYDAEKVLPQKWSFEVELLEDSTSKRIARLESLWAKMGLSGSVVEGTNMMLVRVS